MIGNALHKYFANELNQADPRSNLSCMSYMMSMGGLDNNRHEGRVSTQDTLYQSPSSERLGEIESDKDLSDYGVSSFYQEARMQRYVPCFLETAFQICARLFVTHLDKLLAQERSAKKYQSGIDALL
jgi:hypothetical protein